MVFVPGGRFEGVIAIDGPSGAGKSTVSRELARQLGMRYLDTGAMYRAITWAVLQAGVQPDDAPAVAEVADRVTLAVGTDPGRPHISLDGTPLEQEIRRPAVTAAVSAVSSVPAVRERLVAQQRRLIGAGGIVVEGRDIGTVVVPAATLKIFLTASSGARAGRRGAELGAGSAQEIDATAANLARRDNLDSNRLLSPLRAAPDAVRVDTTGLSLPQVLGRVLDLVRQSTAGQAAPPH